MEKVTEKLERGDQEILDQIERAVRSVHGQRDPDLEQEAYLRTLKAFRRARSVQHPKALIWKIVGDTVADHWRCRRRERWEEVERTPERFLAEDPMIEADLDRARRREQIERAILRLGCDTRGPFYLFYLEGYSIRTLARIYEKSPSAIKMALHRGRRNLAHMFTVDATKESSLPRLRQPGES